MWLQASAHSEHANTQTRGKLYDIQHFDYM
jgi:hypothetical protein